MTSIALGRCTDGLGHAFAEDDDRVDVSQTLCGLRRELAEDSGEFELVCDACAELVLRWASDGREGAERNVGQA